MNSMLTKLALTVGLVAGLAAATLTPSLATNSNDGGPFIYQPGSNGSGWAHERPINRP